MEHFKNMIGSAAANIELSNKELADGHDVTDTILDHIAEIEAAVAEIATLTGQIEVDVALLHARGEEAIKHTASAINYLGEVYAQPEVPDLVNRGITAKLHIGQVNETLEGMQEVMAVRPCYFFELLQSGVESQMISAVRARQGLKMGQKSNLQAVSELEKYTNKL